MTFAGVLVAEITDTRWPSDQDRQSVVFALGPRYSKKHIAALDIANFIEPFVKCRQEGPVSGRRGAIEEPY